MARPRGGSLATGDPYLPYLGTEVLRTTRGSTGFPRTGYGRETRSGQFTIRLGTLPSTGAKEDRDYSILLLILFSHTKIFSSIS